MKLLLDTHAFLWYVFGDAQLSETARREIDDPENAIALSIASVWEIAIKLSIGKLEVAASLAECVRRAVDACGADLQPVTVAQLERVSVLPFPASGHRDPFDRLLAVSALELDCKIVSRDACFDDYAVERVW